MPAANADHLNHSEPDSERRALHALDRDSSPRCAPQQESDRLSEIATLFGDELAHVNRGLEQYVRDGLSPAMDSASHLFEGGGKRVRPLMVILSAACFGTPPPAARDVAIVAELVHLATLLHDDVVDDGQERRGRPASRRIWGNAVSVLAGDSLLTHALQITKARAPTPILVDLLRTLRRLVDGEVIQLESRMCVVTNEEVYLQVARDKTASLFEWAARSGATCANASRDAASAMGAFGAHLGLAFQLVDDVLDYSGDPRSVGKSLLADLVEGKVTLPLIRAVSSNPDLLTDIESIRAGDRRAVSRVAAAVRSSGACASVRALARDESRRAAAALGAAPMSAARGILERVARDLADRIT
jgi:octaprenyl-diphosphate synthase